MKFVDRDWHYTYHERLASYKVIVKRPLLAEPKGIAREVIKAYALAEGKDSITGFKFILYEDTIDQIRYVIEKLKQVPYSRRAQAITWQPWKDIYADSPPCLQRIWCRVVGDKLVMHVHMRSNDAMKASFMNMYAFTELQKLIAEELNLETGYYLHVADSYHIYERDWRWAEVFTKQIESGVSKKYWKFSKILTN